jgi:2-dehydropantoate 2-reductase
MFVVGLKFRKLKSSMLQSLERGRPAEIEFMNGYVVQKGEQTGVPTPINTALTSMVREIDSGQRQIDPLNLDELIQMIK